MKVLFLSQIVPYPPHGGVLQRGYNLLREISQFAVVHLAAFVHRDLLKTDEQVLESQRELGKFCGRVDYFPLWPKQSRLHQYAALGLSLGSPKPFSVIAHRSAAFQRHVSRLVSSEGIDVIHVDTLGLAPFVDNVDDIPRVLTHHNIESMLMGRRAEVETRPPVKWFLQCETEKLRAYERAVSPRFDANILVSDADERALCSAAPGVVTSVVPNGVDIEYFSPRDEADTPTLTYTGGLNMFANRDAVMFFLRETWPLIKAEVPNVRFVVIGQDPPEELRALSAGDPRIEVMGYVDDVRPFVARAAVYVVPLRVGGGTRVKVLDAMAMGKAIVSTSVGCEGIHASPGEHLLVADDPTRFARTVVDLLHDRTRRASLGRAARRLVETRYAWPLIGRTLHDTYRAAIERRSRRTR
jgi:sugar transferase (PEP-CTERM/EpsH1 system associated)